MAEALFGAPGGSRLAEQDQNAAALNQLAMMKAPFEIEHLQQQSRHLGALSSKEELALQNEQRTRQMLEAYQNRRGAGGTGGGSSPAGGTAGTSPLDRMSREATDLMDLAGFYTSIGKVEEGRKLVGTGSQILGRVELAKEHQGKAAADAFKLQSQVLDSGIRALQGIDSQEKFDTAKMNWMMNHPGQQVPGFFEQEYSPELVKNMIDSTVSQKDRMSLQFKEQQEVRRREAMAATERHRQAEEKIQSARLGLEQRRVAVYEKTHGPDSVKPGKAPTRDERLEASAVLKSAYPDLKDAEQLNTAAELIAADAAVLVRQNPGLDRKTALARAVANRKDDFKTDSGGWFSSKSTKFSGTVGPAKDTIVDGYRFLGGNPKDKSSWAEVDEDDEGDD